MAFRIYAQAGQESDSESPNYVNLPQQDRNPIKDLELGTRLRTSCPAPSTRALRTVKGELLHDEEELFDQEPKRRDTEAIDVKVLLMASQVILLLLQLLLSKWPWGDGICLTLVSDLCILSAFVLLFGERFHSTFWKVETVAETFVKDLSDWSDFLKQSKFSFLENLYTDSTDCFQRVRRVDLVVPELGSHFPGEVMVNALLPLHQKHKQELLVLRHSVDLRLNNSRSDLVKSFPIQLNARQLCHKEAIGRVAVTLQCQNHGGTRRWASGASGAAAAALKFILPRAMIPNVLDPKISSNEFDSFLTLFYSDADKKTEEQLEDWMKDVKKWRVDWPSTMGQQLQHVLKNYLEMAGSLGPKDPKVARIEVAWTMPTTWTAKIWQWMDQRAAEAPKIFFTLLPLNGDISAPFAQRSRAQKLELSPPSSKAKFDIRLPNQLSHFSSGRLLLLIWLQYQVGDTAPFQVVQELLGITEDFQQLGRDRAQEFGTCLHSFICLFLLSFTPSFPQSFFHSFIPPFT